MVTFAQVMAGMFDLQAKATVWIAYLDDIPDVRESVPLVVTVDAAARVEQVIATIGAKPPGPVPVAKVAEVREGGSDASIIDFGRMRTVTGVWSSDTISTVFAWQGAAFAFFPLNNASGTALEFPEVLTERLRVDGVSAEKMRQGTVVLPTAPTDLELVVDGKRVWFNSGEAKRKVIGVPPGTPLPDDPYFVAQVDITEAVATAAQTMSARTGAAANVTVELRCATSGVLSLAVDKQIARVHQVDFPGPQQSVTLAAEGATTLPLPLPAEATSWVITGVSFTAASRIEATRVDPPIEPVASTTAELVLDGDHPVALQALAPNVATFGEIAGVRVLVRVDEGSAELGGLLLADKSGAPSAALDGGELVPVIIDRGPRSWQTLMLRRPISAPPGPLWIALQTAHGTATLALANTGGDIKRGRVGGPWRGFSSSIAITPRAALRLVGIAPEGRILDAFTATLRSGSVVATQPFTPTSEGALVTIDVPEITPSTSTLALELVGRTAGTVRFENVQIFYRANTD